MDLSLVVFLMDQCILCELKGKNILSRMYLFAPEYVYCLNRNLCPMKSYFLLFGLLVLSITGLAQENKTGFSVYFQTNSAVLDEKANASLDSLRALLENSASYTIELSAHTDQQGNPYYNRQLSRMRERSVQDQLVKLGLSPESIKGSYHGEEMPVIQDVQTEDIQENRRVEIRVNYLIFSNVEEVLSYTGINSQQKFTFEDKGSQEVQGTKGTQLMIPADAFQTKSGQAIPNNEVVFVLEEFPGMGEAISHQLSTLSGGQILESGGMFRMEAYYQGEALELKEGKEIDVRLPSTNLQAGMSVFVGNRNEQGVVVWEDTKEAFNAVDTAEKPKLPLPGYAEIMRAHRVVFPEKPKYIPLEFVMRVPSRPQVPVLPRKPVVPQEPVQPEGENPGWTGILKSEWRDYKRTHNNYREALANYDTRLEQYEKHVLRYEERYSLYQADSAEFLEDSAQWQNLLDLMVKDRLELARTHYAYYDALRFNGVLNSMARKMDDSSYYSSMLLGDLNRISNVTMVNDVWNSLERIHRDLRLLGYITNGDFPKNQRYICTKNQVDYKLFMRSEKYKRLPFQVTSSIFPELVQYRSNQYYLSLVTDTTKRKTLQVMEVQIREKKKELGIFDMSDTYNLYEASLSRMGYINCDRFASYAPEQMTSLNVTVPPGSKVFVVLTKSNSLVPLYSGHDSTAGVRLPLGEEIKVVSVGSYNGRPTYDYRKLKLKSQGNFVTLEPKIVTLETLTQQLDGL